MPVLALGTFDKDVDERMSLKFSKLYFPGQKNLFFNRIKFAQSAIHGILTSLVLFGVTLGNGKNARHWRIHFLRHTLDWFHSHSLHDSALTPTSFKTDFVAQFWWKILSLKAGSFYASNLLRPAIDGCREIGNFVYLIWSSPLWTSSDLQLSKRALKLTTLSAAGFDKKHFRFINRTGLWLWISSSGYLTRMGWFK